MSTVEISHVDTPDGVMTVSVATPDGAVRGGIVVGQMAFGVDPYIEGVCGDLAASGYVAAAPHLFHRTGGGTVAYDDLDRVRQHYEALTEDGLLSDLDATLTLLRSEHGVRTDQIGTLGFCFGGRVSFLAACRRDIAAAVCFYPTGVVTPRIPQLPPLVDEAPTMNVPWLALLGAQDPYLPEEDVEALAAAAEQTPVAAEVVVYETAGHGFHSTVHGHHDPAAAADGWQRTLTWFSNHLSPPALIH